MNLLVGSLNIVEHCRTFLGKGRCNILGSLCSATCSFGGLPSSDVEFIWGVSPNCSLA